MRGVTTSLPQKENAFIGQHRYSEYARWHLGIDEEKGTTPSAGTSSLMGFQDECIVVRYSLRNAGQYSTKISISKTRRAHLHGMLDALMEERKAS
jgi:hypothetical protein